ncbi:MAG: DUF1223 domain-containing protein [Alphaproteobacteria bacterium]|nr:DUF1223 domain-containing protein [Alphaproteobacteria bacterium]
MRAAAMGVVASLAAGGVQADNATRPVVVELFTSQGCSSCPPADALLGDLANRPGVLALGFHVDYWDSRSWRDPFSTPEATARQRDYAQHFNGGQIYTPQMVVDGIREMVGSDARAVAAALAAPRAAATRVAFAGDGRSVTVGAGTGRGRVLLVRFLRHRTTPIGGGENASRTATDTNAVETLAVLGDWAGGGVSYTIEPPRQGEGVAVLVQAADGQILGAAGFGTREGA